MPPTGSFFIAPLSVSLSALVGLACTWSVLEIASSSQDRLVLMALLALASTAVFVYWPIYSTLKEIFHANLDV